MSNWTPAPIPPDEVERLSLLERLGVDESQSHPSLDALTAIAASLLRAPIALVSLVAGAKQFFLSRQGLDATSTGRPESFCGHCVTSQQPLSVADAFADQRFRENPLSVGAPHVRSYLGIPLLGSPGQSAVGTLCVIDHVPHAWTREDEVNLQRLASVVDHYLEGLAAQRAWRDAPLAFAVLDRTGRCLHGNSALARLMGRPLATILDQPISRFVVPADASVMNTMVAQVFRDDMSPTRRELRFVRMTGDLVVGGTSISRLQGVEGQAVCVIRDVSLERRASARLGVQAEVRSEIGQPLDEARAIVRGLRLRGTEEESDRLGEAEVRLDRLETLLDARMGDVAARAKAEADLRAAVLQLRSLIEGAIGPRFVIDDRGRILDSNEGACSELGWQREELLGRSLRVVHPAFTDAECLRWFAQASPVPTDLEDPVQFVRRDGVSVSVELRKIPVDWSGPGRLAVILTNVTAAREREFSLRKQRDDLEVTARTSEAALAEQLRMEEALHSSLREKETLLKEVHHRVKNNLQIVSSLLMLQMDQFEEPKLRQALAETVHRVRSMALIHQQLYGAESLGRIDLHAYAKQLTHSLHGALAPTCRLQVEAASVEVTVEHAVPIGLLLNELITNALKYGTKRPEAATPPAAIDGRPDVVVTIVRRGGEIELSVRDWGPGLPPDVQLGRTSSRGLQLVQTLTHQLRGKLSVTSDRGATFRIVFPT